MHMLLQLINKFASPPVSLGYWGRYPTDPVGVVARTSSFRTKRRSIPGSWILQWCGTYINVGWLRWFSGSSPWYRIWGRLFQSNWQKKPHGYQLKCRTVEPWLWFSMFLFWPVENNVGIKKYVKVPEATWYALFPSFAKRLGEVMNSDNTWICWRSIVWI